MESAVSAAEFVQQVPMFVPAHGLTDPEFHGHSPPRAIGRLKCNILGSGTGQYRGNDLSRELLSDINATMCFHYGN
jgi:hypothetical protein